MTVITVSAPDGGRAVFTRRNEGTADRWATSIPGSVELPALAEDGYFQVTLRVGGSSAWSETFAVRPPASGAHDLEDLERLPLGEAAAGGFVLGERVADLEHTLGGEVFDRLGAHELALEDSSDAVQALQTLLGDVDALEVDTSAGTLISLNGTSVFYDSGWRDVSSRFGDGVDLDHSFMHVKRTLGELRFRGHVSFSPGTGATFILKLPATSGWVPEISGSSSAIGPVMTFAGGTATTHFVRLNTFRDFAYMGTFSGGTWTQDRPTGASGISFDVSLTASDTLPTSLIDTPA